MAFALVSQTGLVDSPSATVQSFFEPDPEELGEPVETSFALFRPFPLVERGLYSTNLTFDRAGEWAIQATVLGDDASPKRARLFFEVPEASKAPAIGDAAIKSVNRTERDVESLAELTTGFMKDPDLYQVTIADAVESGKPTVIVMASPAFCTNAVCGPQVEVLRELKNEFPDSANFIHVDLYDNPMRSRETWAERSSRRLCASGTCPVQSGRSSLIATARSQAGSRGSARSKSCARRWSPCSSVPTAQF